MKKLNLVENEKMPVLPDHGLAAALPEGIICLSPDQNIIWWNQAAQTLLKLTKKSQGKSITAELLDDTFKNYLSDFANFAQPCEFPAPRDPNLHLAVELLPYGKGGHILIVRDVTHTYHLEKMRQDFVANVSHELRTPLTVLRGYLESLLDNLPQAMAQHAHIFNQMQQQTWRMERIIEDLLLLSRLETDLPDAQAQEPIEMLPLLQMISEDARALSADRQHQIQLEITGPTIFYGRKAELQSAFSNLVFNAVHYTPAKGHITIRWYEDNKGLHFEVRDTGIGIESKHIPRLTERFYRVDPGRTRQTGGTGLGLAIVKHVLLRHQGQLEIKSKPGQGSIFRCNFPKMSSKCC